VTTTTFDTTSPAVAARSSSPSVWRGGLLAAVVWLAASGLTILWPDGDDWGYTGTFGDILIAVGLGLALLALAGRRLFPGVKRWVTLGPWLVAAGLAVALWELATAKIGLLPHPFFVTPQELFGVYVEDWRKLFECVFHSVLLLATGYGVGIAVGFATGVAIGWSRAAAYWGHPILRVIGPLPATAWLPIAFFAFPSSWSASVFLIALASGVPVAVLTWSGVASVSSAYYDIARTLGANQRFLVLEVAVPAAMPNVFVGLFMGLCASFAVLVVAEMMGVKAGLGWYLQWAQGWAAYANMYAALAVMAVMCSSLVALLFRLREHLLAWQKGLLRW
jgi:NitT/TauT family transport system permease protein